MKKNIIAIGLVFATLLTFASCKKLPQDNEFVYERHAYVVDDEGVTHNIKTEIDENGKEIYYYEDFSGNKVTVANKDVVVKTTKVRKTTSVYENQELTPEEQSLLDTFNDPEVFENLVDESLTQPEFEISDEPIPEENFEEIEVKVDNDGNPVHNDIEKTITDIIDDGKYTIDTVIKTTDVNGEEMILPLVFVTPVALLGVVAVLVFYRKETTTLLRVMLPVLFVWEIASFFAVTFINSPDVPSSLAFLNLIPIAGFIAAAVVIIKELTRKKA